ncbi:MAG: 3-deoxy-manno-octulosonate cytidylyltransferase [Bdellovibrionota bacterium]
MNLIVIPARMAASRFPGKPMTKILGRPMIEHIVRRSHFAKLPDVITVATCDREIHDFVTGLGFLATMTGSQHERATERVAEALAKIEKEKGSRAELVIMVQGDEPMVDPGMIDMLIEGLKRSPDVDVLNLMIEIRDDSEFLDPNAVKVVVDPKGDALYFSREPIPSSKKGYKGPRYKQLGMIGFRRDYLLRYVALQPTPLEIAESVDMMRVLENGDKIRMLACEARCLAVDAPHDVAAVEAAMQDDEWRTLYETESQA